MYFVVGTPFRQDVKELVVLVTSKQSDRAMATHRFGAFWLERERESNIAYVNVHCTRTNTNVNTTQGTYKYSMCSMALCLLYSTYTYAFTHFFKNTHDWENRICALISLY